MRMRLGRCITDPAKHVQYRRESRASCQSDDDCGLAVCHAYPVYDSAALVIDHRKETVVSSAPIRSTGTGYLFIGPAVPTRTKTLRDGIALDAYHKTGVIVSENPQSPWYHATIFLQGTAVSDRQGQTIRDVALCESTDADGDLTWSILWSPAAGPSTLQLVVGTRKWEGISGKGELCGVVRTRADGHAMPTWKIDWLIDQAASQHDGAPIDEGEYSDHDRGLSFHGPHVPELTRELANGIRLIVSNQSGVLLSENPEAKGPRNYATVFDRGTTIQMGSETLGDVMLLEDTDPDGDIAWLVHIWWYGKGPGTYRFIGGTGKWAGIIGQGKTLGSLRRRSDDHHMLRSEMHWRIERGD